MSACPPDRRNGPRRPRCVPRALTASSVVGDFALHEAVRGRVIGVSDPHVVQFPPINRVQAMTHVGLVPKTQTTSLNSAGNTRILAKWSALWAQRHQAWHVVCT